MENYDEELIDSDYNFVIIANKKIEKNTKKLYNPIDDIYNFNLFYKDMTDIIAELFRFFFYSSHLQYC